jgi:hypothetical protein
MIRGVGDSPYKRYAESATPCIADSGESISDNEHLREFESKIWKALVIVRGTCAEPTLMYTLLLKSFALKTIKALFSFFEQPKR